MTLYDLLLYLVSGGGAAVVAYWLMEKVPFFQDIDRPDYKRYMAYALTGAIALWGWAAMMLMDYAFVPATWQAGVEQGFSVVCAAIVGNQVIHAGFKLRPRPEK